MYDEDMARPISLLFVLGLVLLVLFPRVLTLDAFRSPDEDRWMANTNGFVKDLAQGHISNLVKLPHPGITTQWLGALTIRSNDWAIKKLPLVIGQSLLILLAGYVFGRLWGRAAGIFTILTLAANPLLYAHTRVYAMDSLLALFSALALGFLLLWHKENQHFLATRPVEQDSSPEATRYLIAAAFCTAAAIFSKMSGVLLIPFILFLIIAWTRHWKSIAVWLAALVVSSILILPTLAIHPLNVLGDMTELFRSGDYQDHHLGQWYYVRTLVFFSTPLHWLSAVALAWLCWQKKISRDQRNQLVILLLFAVLFFAQMTLGAKKGDRYILPSFAAFDVVAAFVIAKIQQVPRKVPGDQKLEAGLQLRFPRATSYLLLATIVWQFGIIWQTHPHTLAYINPLTKPWFADRRHGWGEGLDLAAAYLNTKPNAENLKVATYYPTEFGIKFKGETVAVHQHDSSNSDYVIIYRAMFERGPEAWETDVINHYHTQKPEHTISFQNVPFVWIYAIK